MKGSFWMIVAAAISTGSGCNRLDSGDGSSGSAVAGVNKVDSILPPGEALRRFTAGIPPVSQLENGATSRDSLVSHFMRFVNEGDTAALGRLSISRAEYGFLYYPTSVYARKPYELAPDLAWMLNQENSRKGLSRLLTRVAGKNVAFVSHVCGDRIQEGMNGFWRDCRITYRSSGAAKDETRKLFGVIMVREGQFKILSYANDF